MKDLELRLSETIDSSEGWSRVGNEVDSKVVRLVIRKGLAFFLRKYIEEFVILEGHDFAGFDDVGGFVIDFVEPVEAKILGRLFFDKGLAK